MENNITAINGTIKIDLDIDDWIEYRIGDLFKIQTGTKRQNVHTKGDYPLIATGTKNNGVCEYITIDDDSPLESNSITVSNIDAEAIFYHSNSIYVTQNVFQLTSKKNTLNKKIAMFLIPIIKKHKNGYGWGNYIGKQGLLDLILRLPSKLNTETNQYEPDWQYMDDYITDLENDLRVEEIKQVSQNISFVEKETIDIDDWIEYRIGDLFEVEIAKSIDKGKLKEEKNGVNYITRKSTNNGLEYKVENIENLINTGNCITVSMVGNNKGSSFYQKDNFLSSQNMLIFRNKNINKNIGLFIINSFEKIYKISSDYNAIKKDTVLKDKIFFPSILNEATDQYEPDWQYMEDYISDLEKDLSSFEQ